MLLTKNLSKTIIRVYGTVKCGNIVESQIG